MKKKILITYATYGSGHKAVANYIYNYLKDKNEYELKIIDIMDYENIIGKISKKLFEENFKHEGLFIYNSIYNMFNHKFTCIYYKQITKSIFKNKELKETIIDFNPDIVISSHFFGTIISSLYKRKKLINPKIMSILTDYGVHELWIKELDNINALVVGNDLIKEDLLRKGISSNKIFPYGIPVSNKFDNYVIKKEKSNLDILFFAGGSIGSNFSYKYFKSILKTRLNYNITLVCGHNEKLKKKCQKLTMKYNKDKIKVLGFTTNVNELLDKCDLVITKPGGISITECMKKKRPMLLIPGNGGPEMDNLRYLCRKGFGINCKTPKKLSKTVSILLSNRKILNNMYKNLEKENNNNSLENIYNLIKEY